VVMVLVCAVQVIGKDCFGWCLNCLYGERGERLASDERHREEVKTIKLVWIVEDNGRV